MFEISKLTQAEKEIQNLLNQNEANWKDVAKIALAVREKELFKQSGMKSFTAWVKMIAERCDRQPSLIWRYIKAAKYYLHTVGSDDVEQIDDALAKLDEVIAAPEALVNLEKIERNAPEPVFEKLKEKVLTGEATVRETRAIEQEYRPEPEKQEQRRGRPPKDKEGSYEHLGRPKTEEDKPKTTEIKELPRNQIAATISRSLKINLVNWTKKAGGKAYPAKLYQDHTEVRVNLDRHRFRLDFLAVVRWSFKKPKDIFVVEIKSSMSDFSKDEKWQNYLNFCDYFCFAIPKHEEKLLELIEVSTDAGILLVDLNSEIESSMAYPVTVHRKPKKWTGKYAAKFKHLVYETLYERLLHWTGTDDLNSQ